jgi:hypothetical protein
MNKLKQLLVLVASLLLVVSTSWAQATLTSTTLSAAITSTSDSVFRVTSATGFSVGRLAYVDREAISISSVTGTTISGLRGANGTQAGTHASGATIYVGPPTYFTTYDRAGSCTATSEVVLPRVNISSGNVWTCTGSLWVLNNFVGAGVAYTTDILTSVHVGTPVAGVTAAEYGTSRDHTTKLTFTDLSIGSSTGATNLAIGKKVYDFPAGAIVVRDAYMSVGLTGGGATCDADTPDGGIGTVIGSGVVDVLGGTGTFEDMLTGQTFNNLTGTAEVKTISNQVLTIEAASAHTVHFNLADGWAGACAITGTGTITLQWSFIQ